MFMRWKVAFLSPLLTLVLLLPIAPLQAQAAGSVTSCAAGGQVTVTTTTSMGTVTLTVQCTGTVLTVNKFPGGSSTQYFVPTPPADASWNGQYCAGSPSGIDQTYWNRLAVTRTGAGSGWGSWITTASGAGGGGAAYYTSGSDFYTLNSSFDARAHMAGSSIGDSGIIGSSTGDPTVAYRLWQAIEVSGDAAGGPGYPDFSPQDATSQRSIVSGPVYNRLDLTGAQWTGGADPYTTWRWGIASYTTTYNTVLVSPGYWTNMNLSGADWSNGGYYSYYWVDWYGYGYPSYIATPDGGSGSPYGWPAEWQYQISGASSWDGVSFSWPNDPAWVAPVYRTDTIVTPNYGWIPTNVPGVAPTCQGGQWNFVPYLYSSIVVALMQANGWADVADIYLWPGAVTISTPPLSSIIPGSWTNLGALAGNVQPGSYKQVKGQPNIQVVGVAFPYSINGQSYTGAPIVNTLVVPATDPATGVQYTVTLVSTVGLTGVKWDWGDPGASGSGNGDQTMYFGAQGVGSCTPAPFCGPVHTPTHVGNFKVNVWEYYGSSIWAYYYDPTRGGVVSVDLGSGTNGYLGCPSDPNPSTRPGGSSFCLTPTPAAPGTPQTLVGGVQMGGYPYSVGQVEGVPAS